LLPRGITLFAAAAKMALALSRLQYSAEQIRSR
jgi:hypothetical protein